MILVAESGSTKTDWCLIDHENKISCFRTGGLNLYYQSTIDIQRTLANEVIRLIPFGPEKIYFYGAGCTPGKKSKLFEKILRKFFNESVIEVQSDLLAAARSLFQNQPGIACILGTGTNTGHYNGSAIDLHVPGLGYMLGDEGSGAVLGKKFLSFYLRNNLPEQIMEAFVKQYQLNKEDILENVYKMQFPNRFLGSFVPFIAHHQEHPYVYQMIYHHFSDFYNQILSKYRDYIHEKISFTGSVAYYFSDFIRNIGNENGFQVQQIDKSPLEGLLQYHSNYNV